MDLVEVDQPHDVTRGPLQGDTAAGTQLAGSRPGFFGPRLQLGSMATRGILEPSEHFVKAWMKLKHPRNGGAAIVSHTRGSCSSMCSTEGSSFQWRDWSEPQN